MHEGEIRWDLIHPFPRPDPADKAIGDSIVSELADLLPSRVDPTVLDEHKALPDGLLDTLRERGFFKLTVGEGLGGRGRRI